MSVQENAIVQFLLKCTLLFVPTDKAKRDALRSAAHVSELLVDTVNGGVQESFINEKRIELEIRALVTTIMRYKKQTNQWLAASHGLNTILKVCSIVRPVVHSPYKHFISTFWGSLELSI